MMFTLVETFGQMSISFALVNALPIPGLTGAHLLTTMLPTARGAIVRSQPYAAVAMAALAGAVSLRMVALPSGIAAGLDRFYRAVAALILGE